MCMQKEKSRIDVYFTNLNCKRKIKTKTEKKENWFKDMNATKDFIEKIPK